MKVGRKTSLRTHRGLIEKYTCIKVKGEDSTPITMQINKF